MKRFSAFFALSFLLLCTISCEKNNEIIEISGEFARTSGTCTPYCLMDISGEILSLRGIDFSGSTSIVYVEIYERDANDVNTYWLQGVQGSYIEVKSRSAFTFTSSVRTCEFRQ